MMDPQTLARLRYPFPTLVNPHAEAMQELTDQEWIDRALCGVVDPKLAEKFKKVRTAYMTSYFFPMASWRRLVPLARMMVFSLYQDDVYEQARPDHVRYLREHIVAAARGQSGSIPADVPLARWIQLIRSELRQLVPDAPLDRWASAIDGYFEGLTTETTLSRSGEYPSVADYLEMREKALMLHPFMELKEVETGVVLPPHVHDHPAVRRLKSLAVRIIGHFNELQSFDKDEHTGMSNVNLVNVLTREHTISVSEACERVFALHAEDLAEFIRLQHSLPDFSDWHDSTANYIHHISFVISGWRGVDSIVQRYDPEFYIDRNELEANLPGHTQTVG